MSGLTAWRLIVGFVALEIAGLAWLASQVLW